MKKTQISLSFSQDLLVWLDSADFHEDGQVSLWRYLGYTPAQLDLIVQRSAVGINTHIELTLRTALDPYLWLGGAAETSTDSFEIWRWSWNEPAALGLLDNATVSVTAFSYFPQSNLVLAAAVAAAGTFLLALLHIVKMIATKPWQRVTVEPGPQDAEYEKREFRIVWFRALPYEVLVSYAVLFLTALFGLSLNLSYVHPVAFLIYTLCFWYLTAVIVDVFIGKLLLYIGSMFFYHVLPQHLKDPIPPGSITQFNGMLLLNPLRPANDEQLRAVVRKNVDMLAGTSGSRSVVSVLILQAVGNSTDTFRRYEKILREEIFNNAYIPQDVVDRFFVFCMRGIAKPHNVYKALRFLHRQPEDDDVVTKDFIYGIKCADPLPTGSLVDGLVRLGGDTTTNPGQGSDAGILTSPLGLRLLNELRGTGATTTFRLPNMLILDADNSVDPVLILQMCATMTDDFMVWQPAINVSIAWVLDLILTFFPLFFLFSSSMHSNLFSPI